VPLSVKQICRVVLRAWSVARALGAANASGVWHSRHTVGQRLRGSWQRLQLLWHDLIQLRTALSVGLVPPAHRSVAPGKDISGTGDSRAAPMVLWEGYLYGSISEMLGCVELTAAPGEPGSCPRPVRRLFGRRPRAELRGKSSSTEIRRSKLAVVH